MNNQYSQYSKNNYRLAKKLSRFFFLIPLILFLIISSSGCGSLVGKPKEEAKPDEQMEEIPKQLGELDSTLEKIFITLDGPSINKREESGEGQDKQSQGNNDTQTSENSSSQEHEDQKKNTDQGKNNSESKEDNQTEKQKQDPWPRVSQDIEKLHLTWNEYLPAAATKGADKELLDRFSTALNDFSVEVKTKDRAKVLLAANRLYENIPELFALYKSKSLPGIKHLIYYTREIILNGTALEWEKAESNLEKLKSTWPMVKATLEKEEQLKLEHSITELEKVTKNKYRELITLKGKIVLQNLAALEKSLQEEDEQQ